MERLLQGYVGVNCWVYLDDLLIFSRSFEKHVEDVDAILGGVVQRAGLTLKLPKCRLFEDHVDYLGHVISARGVEVCADKVEAVKHFKRPESQTQVRAFLGLAGYYRRYIENFSPIAAPLFDLTKTDKTVPTTGRKRAKPPFQWTAEAQIAFDTLKERLCSAPVLHYPDFQRQFHLATDACKVGAGAVLFQLDDDGSEHPVAYWSTVFTAAERKYATVEKECLALVKAVKHFRPYLYGVNFVAHTDHKSLQWLHSISSDPSGRLARWSLILNEYDIMEIRYKKGSTMVHADGLSREHDVGLL